MANRDILDIPTIRDEWNRDNATAIRGVLLKIRDAFTGGIVETVHTNSRYLTLEVYAPTSAPQRIASGMNARPASVELVDFYRRDPSYLSASIAGTLQWEWDGGDIVLPQLSGLVGSGTYVVKLLARG